MVEHDFTEWNKAFDKLRHKHDTWYIFRDFLDMTIDNFTIPDQQPLFENKDKYTEEEYGYFGELFTAYVHHMDKALETKLYYDFLGTWWENDVNMTNKFKAQFFTPVDVCDIMVALTVGDDTEGEPKTMYDCCCGSGRFGLAYHHYRPKDYFFFNDLDQYAVKMTILNMLFHGMQGVVAYMNTLTEEVFECWRVTPFWGLYGRMPYVVPYGSDLWGALSFLPREHVNGGVGTMNSDNVTTVDSDNTLQVEEVTETVKPKGKVNKGVLDDWL